MGVSHLSPAERITALGTLDRFALRGRSDPDLLDEIELRSNDIACYRLALAEGDYTNDEHAEALEAGIRYELAAIDTLISEGEKRQAAARYGYKARGSRVGPDLRRRFDQVRACGAQSFADRAGSLTGQVAIKSGNNFKLKCPFHGDGRERSASFTIFPDAIGHCFGCGVHLDAVGFLAKLRGIGSVEALQLIEAGAI